MQKTLNFIAALLCFSMQCKSTTSVNNACLLPYHRFWFGQSWKKFTTHHFFTSLQLCEIALFISLKHSVSLSGSQLPVSHLISQHLANHSVIQLSRKSACQWNTLIMSIGLFWASKSASQLVSQTVNYQPANQLFHCSVSLWNNEKTFG